MLLLFVCHMAVASLSGDVSTYARSLDGNRQASGEYYDEYEFTAASLVFALGTRLLVYSVLMDKYVVVTVTDRGPYEKGRVLDLSYVAMKHLGLLDVGWSRCVIIPLTPIPVPVSIAIFI